MNRYFPMPLACASLIALCAADNPLSVLVAKPRPTPISTSAVIAPPPASATLVRHRKARRQVRPSLPIQHVASANRSATEEPEPQGFINAIQIYPFSDGVLYQLYAAPERVTDVALQPGEALVAVASGDTVRWVIGDTTSGAGATKQTHILVKPFVAGLSTNLVITTDRHSYHLTLASTAKTAMAALSWTYPQDQLVAIRHATEAARVVEPVAEGLALDHLHFNYIVTGDQPAWRPLRAFDDGRQTFIEFPPSLAVGEAPPLFLVDTKGEAQLVNYRLRGRFYVVDRIFDVAELRLGTKHQDIVHVARVAETPARRRRA